MNYLTNRAKAKKVLISLGLILVFAQIFAGEGLAQKRKAAPKSAKRQIVTKKPKPTAVSLQNSNLPKVTQINEVALRKLLKREDANAKPLLVNFWATWCDPCREEFPDLVKLDADYKGKIDLITISLDELSEINGDVPKFLAEMKAEMPSYLLKTPSEETAIASVSKSWQGGLPFTILFDGQGKTVYFIQGKFKTELLRAEIEKLFNINSAPEVKLNRK
ncbi:MAG: redoxin domain-containing protein [Pyrinomonadaceae bacterium]